MLRQLLGVAVLTALEFAFLLAAYHSKARDFLDANIRTSAAIAFVVVNVVLTFYSWIKPDALLFSLFFASFALIAGYALASRYFSSAYYVTTKWLEEHDDAPTFPSLDELRGSLTRSIKDQKIVDAIIGMYAQEQRPDEYPEAYELDLTDSDSDPNEEWIPQAKRTYERRCKASQIVAFYEEAAAQVALLMRGIPEPTRVGRLQIELTDIYDNMGSVVGELAEIFRTKEALDLRVAQHFWYTFDLNRQAVSLRYLSKSEYEQGIRINPGQFPGPPEQLAQAYLTNTHLLRLFQ